VGALSKVQAVGTPAFSNVSQIQRKQNRDQQKLNLLKALEQIDDGK
jgi:hypothetical protein